MSQGNIIFTTEKYGIAAVFVLLAERLWVLTFFFRYVTVDFSGSNINIKMIQIHLTFLGVLSVATVFIFCTGVHKVFLICDWGWNLYSCGVYCMKKPSTVTLPLSPHWRPYKAFCVTGWLRRKNLGLIYKWFCIISRHQGEVDNCIITVPMRGGPGGHYWREILLMSIVWSNTFDSPPCLDWNISEVWICRDS